MVTQREHMPSMVALSVSMALHIALVWFDPSWFVRLGDPVMDTVVVELRQTPPGEADQTLQTAPEENLTTDKSVTQAVETGASAVPRGQADDAAGEVPTTPPRQETASPRPETVKLEFTELDPDDEREIMELEEAPPDPAGGLAREVTMRLDETDKRYRGFLAAVRSSIHKNWRSREALLEAQRSGLVLVRFTLGPGGGAPAGLEIIRTSESKVLDSEAARAVSTAGFPPFPAHWTVEKLHLIGEFRYAISPAQ